MRNENTTLQLERETYKSFLLKIFLRSRLLSMTGIWGPSDRQGASLSRIDKMGDYAVLRDG